MLSGIAMAAEVPTSEGDKAMVFSFQGLSELDVDGPHPWGVGMRYYIADYTAIRATLIFGNCSYTEEWDGYDDDYEESYSLYGVEAVYEKHLESPCASVVPYWGIGGGFEMWTDETITPDGYRETYTETESGTAFYFFGALGFEWAFTDCLTLGGEYQAGFWTGSGDTEYEYPGGDSETCCEWSETCMGFDDSSELYLAVYW
jgi:hypothetical protein